MANHLAQMKRIRNFGIAAGLLGISAAMQVAMACSAIKGPISATCPVDATCEAVDFGGAVTLTVCLSAADMAKLKALATERRDKLQAQTK